MPTGNGNRNSRSRSVRRVSLGIGRNSEGDYRVRLARGQTNNCVNMFVNDEIFATVYTDGTMRYWKHDKDSSTINWKERTE